MCFAGCAPEERIGSVKGNFQGLPGAVGGYTVNGAAPRRASTDLETALLKAGASDPRGTPVEGRPLRREMSDGSIILISRSPRQLVQHLAETLRDGEDGLLQSQVLSKRLKLGYEERGMDPVRAVEYLKKHRAEVMKLIASMPLADNTPGAIIRNVGRNTFEIEAPGGAMLDQKFTKLLVVLEEGSFKLLSLG
jgi:hypothetical protein